MRLLLCLCFILAPILASANEITLTKSIENTLNNNPLLQSALEGKEAAKNEITQAKSGYFPVVDLWGSIGMAQEQNQNDRDNNLFSDPVFRFQGGLNLTQNIYNGATGSSIDSREYNYEAAQNTVLDMATNLVLETIIAHSNVVTYAELLTIARNNYQSHEDLVTLLEERHKRGVIARGDYEQGYGKLKKAEISLLSSIEAYDLARLNYEKVTGVYPTSELAPLLLPSTVYREVQDVENLAINNNYKIQEILSQVASLEEQADVASSAYLPSVNFTLNPSYTSKDVDDNDSIMAWDADVNIQWNAFRGFSDQATIQVSNAQVRKTQQDLYDIKETLFLQIGTAYHQTITAQKQLILYEAANVSNLNAKTNFYNQFRVGQKEVLQLLDIEREVHTTQAEYVLAEANLRISHYRLHALAGTLLDELNVNTQALISMEPARTNSGESFSF